MAGRTADPVVRPEGRAVMNYQDCSDGDPQADNSVQGADTLDSVVDGRNWRVDSRSDCSGGSAQVEAYPNR